MTRDTLWYDTYITMRGLPKANHAAGMPLFLYYEDKYSTLCRKRGTGTMNEENFLRREEYFLLGVISLSNLSFSTRCSTRQ